MKKLLCLILAALMLLSLAACGETEKAPKETTSVSAYKSGDGYTELTNKLSWEEINKFPIKSSDMTIDEARQLCIDFFRYAKLAQWIPDDNWDFTHHDDGRSPDTLQSGLVYGGLPYVGLAASSIYRLFDYMDPETGVVNIKDAGQFQKAFGNQCAQGAYVGWSRVINSADYGGTPSMTKANKFFPVGSYTYQNMEILPSWNGDYGTDEVIKNENEADTLYEAYALMKHGDGIVYYTTAGHVVMIATDPVVVRDADGKIDPNQSYVTVIDQTPTWKNYTTSEGQTYAYQANVDEKWTFAKLLKGNYLPFTFAEWLGTDPIEDTEIKFEHEGETITMKELTSSDVTCNYHIYDLYAEVYDKWGSQVLKLANRSKSASNYEARLSTLASEYNTVWGDPDSLKAGGDYTVKVYAQLGTGERPDIWEGKLIVE